MKRNCLYTIVVALLALLIKSDLAAQPEERASLRFVNASALSSNVVFTLDGESTSAETLGPGESTIFFGVSAGTHWFGVTAPDAKDSTSALRFVPNITINVFAYSQPVLDPKTHKVTQQLQLLIQPDFGPDYGRNFYLVYISSRPSVDLVVNGQTRTLQALQQAELDDKASETGTINIDCAGKRIVSFTTKENENFLILLFDKSDGSLAGTVLPGRARLGN